MLGILAALGSSSLRAILNILDRKIFGHKHAGVISVNLVNNLLPFVIVLPIAAFLAGSDHIVEALSDLRNLWLAGLIQIVAYAFSLAFRDLTVPQVIVFSKLPDLLIPIGIFAFSRIWSSADFIFSLLTTLICLPLLFHSRERIRFSTKQWWVLCFLMSTIVIRGIFSGYLVHGQGENYSVWLVITVATLWWRFIWTLFVMIGVMVIRRQMVWILPRIPLLLGRAGITLAVQALYVFALAIGPVTAVWPIINSTALFSTVLSSIILREHPARREVVAITGIIILTLARMFYE